MTDLQRIARDIVFGGNVSNADAVLLWERLTGFRPRQAKRCEWCCGTGDEFRYVSLDRNESIACRLCHGTGYVGGFTPRDAEGQVGAMVAIVNGVTKKTVG